MPLRLVFRLRNSIVFVYGERVATGMHAESFFKVVDALVEPSKLFHDRIGQASLIHIRHSNSVLFDNLAWYAHNG